MAVEFRSSFFGFNRDDVFDYVHKKDAEMKILTASMNEKLHVLEEELAQLKADFNEAVKNNSELSSENSRLSSELEVFKSKSDEIDSLSRKIGKLYLVSKSSAKSIVERAEENAQILDEQTKLRLSNIEQTEESLHTITKHIVSASEKYVSELSSLSVSLAEAKEKVGNKDAERIRISEEFSEIYEKLS